MKRKCLELACSKEFTIEQGITGTHVHGRLAYPGISKNLKLYPIAEQAKADGLVLPIWLNHADIIGTSDIGDDLLPPSYRRRLENKEEIVLGFSKTTFDPNTLEVLYDGYVTDPFYSNPDVLRRMSVSQGVIHPANLPEYCDDLGICYKIMKDSVYEEMSLVFHPGFSIATLSTESYDFRNAFNLRDALLGYMDKSNEKDCGCGKSEEAAGQASGTMPNAGNCGEGMIFDSKTGNCVPAPDGGNPITNAGGPSPSQVAGEAGDDKGLQIAPFGKITKAEEAIKAAKEALDASAKELKESYAALKTSESDDEDEDDKKKKESKEHVIPAGTGPNADFRTRQKAQEKYNDAFEKHMKAIEAQTVAQDAYLKMVMQHSKENAERKAVIGSNTSITDARKSVEGATLHPKQWIDALIKRVPNTPWNKSWEVDEHFLNSFVQRKFRAREGFDLKLVPYASIMDKIKASEATDVAMAGGADPNNFQRTMSELVLVYPNGIVVTPIMQFLEGATLPPGKKEHLFYDVNVPEFAATDEANMDAGGSGYALQPSDIVINASGGKTNPQGGLVRIGFTQLEELPIDVIQKVNIGFSMRAEERKNYDFLTTAWNDNTAYNPATDAVRPRGGGNKFAADNQGNTHMVNGNTGAQLTSTDSGATAALTFAGLLAGKKTIVDTGLNPENIVTYLPWGGILQLLKDTGITSYTQFSLPEVITRGVIEKVAGTMLIPSSGCATGDAATVKRAVMFLPIVAGGMVTGRELQIDAERVARQQSVYCTASMKMASFVKRLEATCGICFNPSA